MLSRGHASLTAPDPKFAKGLLHMLRSVRPSCHVPYLSCAAVLLLTDACSKLVALPVQQHVRMPALNLWHMRCWSSRYPALISGSDLLPRAAGKETVNSMYGTRIAVLAGDFLFAESSAGLARLDNLEVSLLPCCNIAYSGFIVFERSVSMHVRCVRLLCVACGCRASAVQAVCEHPM